MMKTAKYATAVLIITLVSFGIFAWMHQPAQRSNIKSVKTSVSVSTINPAKPAAFDKTKYSLTDPASQWVVVNKHQPLNPKTYAPTDLLVPNVTLRATITGDEKQLRPAAAMALKDMFTAASKENITLNVQSGYRSYAFQVNLYDRYVKQQGKAVADTQSARPGYSEHQTGLAVDVGGISQPTCNIAACFVTTNEGKWLAVNAYKYGFLVRYPEGKTPVTGYTYEPWHVRYIGTDLAAELHKDNVLTLEEFFNLDAAPDYN